MTRLYDRLMRQGTLHYYDGRLDAGLLRHEWANLEAARVFAVDDVVRYVFEMAGDSAQRSWEDSPYLAPPADRCFVETEAPRVARQDGELLPWRDDFPRAWGALLFCADYKEDYEHLGSERWKEIAASETESLFNSVHIPGGRRDGTTGPIGPGELDTPVRLHLRASYYTETEVGDVRGPLASAMMALQPDGRIARFKDGRPLRFLTPFFGSERGSEEQASLAQLAVELLSPLLFSLTFMDSKVTTLEPRTFPQKLQRKQIKKHGRPRMEYNELIIEPFKEVLRTQGSVEQKGLARALHYCRGHLRHYYPERGGPGGMLLDEPMIVHVKGHPRGSKKSGEITKDYRVAPPKKPHRRPPYNS